MFQATTSKYFRRCGYWRFLLCGVSGKGSWRTRCTPCLLPWAAGVYFRFAPPLPSESTPMRFALLPVALAMLSLTGCASFNRVDAQVSRTTTIGQELIDLNKAKEQGLITAEEYQTAKAKVLSWAEVPGQLKTELKAP